MTTTTIWKHNLFVLSVCVRQKTKLYFKPRGTLMQ